MGIEVSTMNSVTQSLLYVFEERTQNVAEDHYWWKKKKKNGGTVAFFTPLYLCTATT